MRKQIFTKHELQLILDYLEGLPLTQRKKKQIRTLRYRARKYYETLKLHFELLEKFRSGETEKIRKENRGEVDA